MATMTFGVDWLQFLMILLAGGGLLGMPPGERDASLLKAAPQQTMLYFEWAARGAGKSGGPGIDGFAADPEVVAFFEALDQAINQSESPELDEQIQLIRGHSLRLMKLVTAHPGCVSIGFDSPPPGESPSQPLDPLNLIRRFRIGLVTSAGKDVELILAALNELAEASIGPRPQMEQVSIPPLGVKLTVHREADRLLIGYGVGAVEKALTGLRGELPGLDANPRFQAGWKRVGLQRVGTVGWVDLRGIVEGVGRILGPAGALVQPIIRGAGLDGVDFIVSGTGVAEGTVIQRTFLATDGRTGGLMVVAGGPPIRADQLRHIPADCDFVAAGSLNLAGVMREVRDLIAKTIPLSVSVYDEVVKQIEAELGLKLDQDAYPALGDVWTAFDSPSEGGVLGSSLIVAIEVRDAKKAGAIFEKLIELLQQSLASDGSEPGNTSPFGCPTGELKQQDFLGHKISYIARNGWEFGATAQQTPSFCLTSGHLLFSLHPQAMKAHLRHLAAGRPGFGTVADLKMPVNGGERIAVAYLDGKRVTEVLGSLVPFFGHALLSIGQSQGVSLDSFAIPSSAALVPYAGDVTFTVTRHKDGLICEARNPQIVVGLVTILAAIRSTMVPSYGEFLEAGAPGQPPVENAGLGAPEGQVIQAAAEKPAPEKPADKPAAGAAQTLTPLILKALIPNDLQQLIPEEVFRKLAEPPSPEVLKQREERRRQLEERRRERAEKRRLRLQP